jgi:DUF2075 family protein
MRAANRTGLPQVRELITASRVCVFFIDDYQIVRPGEIGSVNYLKESAQALNCKLFEYELEAQFRCSGSDAFVNWINNTLEIRQTPNILWKPSKDVFDFRIFSSPFELEDAIKSKIQEGFKARVTAGFCWPWSDPDGDGKLIDDVVIADYRRPWNANPEATKLAKGIPKATLWANDPNGINQIGCLYTAQGFEFDYVGVIFGQDLVYEPSSGNWIGLKEHNADKFVKRAPQEDFTNLVKNTYRVLLSRGMKGCYVHFMDENTRNFFRSRIEFS